MPVDLFSVLALILLNAADLVQRIGPYVLGGIALAALLSQVIHRSFWQVLLRVPHLFAMPLAGLLGAISPLPTTSAVPMIIRLRSKGLADSVALAFVLASSLMNPQLFLLTIGALGPKFALGQLASVLLLSIGTSLLVARKGNSSWFVDEDKSQFGTERQQNGWMSLVTLAEHVTFYFLAGALVGASVQVLLPWSGVLDWMSRCGWLSNPMLGWIGAPFYMCGGSAVPFARSLMLSGFRQGTLFTFLLVGPVMRGTTLANLGCLLSKRSLAMCITALVLAGGILGCAFDWLVGAF